MREHESDFSGRPLVWGAGALVLAGAGLVYALWPKSPDARPAPAITPARAVATPSTQVSGPRIEPALKPRQASKPEPHSAPPAETPPPAIDLFATPGPEIIDVPHGIVARGGTVNMLKLKEVYQYAKDHPGDARPHLVMAGDAVNRGWYDQAIGHYVRAAKEDPRAKQDERMLPDLVKAASREHSARAAGDALAEVYGRSALDAVRSAIDQASADDEDEGRLTRLSDLLLRLEAGAEKGQAPK